MYGTGADPNIITFGPKVGGQPDWEPYPSKTSMEFELNHGAPVLAPIDMALIGFQNGSAEYRIRSDGSFIDAPHELQNFASIEFRPLHFGHSIGGFYHDAA